MQDRYVGDVGDFVKFGILRALAGDHRVGVAWWLHPDETHNGDGRHTTYLERSNWRDLDQPLFDALNGIVQRDARNVAALEAAGLLANAIYLCERYRQPGLPQRVGSLGLNGLSALATNLQASTSYSSIRTTASRQAASVPPQGAQPNV